MILIFFLKALETLKQFFLRLPFTGGSENDKHGVFPLQEETRTL